MDRITGERGTYRSSDNALTPGASAVATSLYCTLFLPGLQGRLRATEPYAMPRECHVTLGRLAAERGTLGHVVHSHSRGIPRNGSCRPLRSIVSGESGYTKLVIPRGSEFYYTGLQHLIPDRKSSWVEGKKKRKNIYTPEPRFRQTDSRLDECASDNGQLGQYNDVTAAHSCNCEQPRCDRLRKRLTRRGGRADSLACFPLRLRVDLDYRGSD